jgi:hypothetical protein
MLALALSVAHPDIFENGFAAAAQGALWVPIHLLAIVALVLTLFGATGLYARQAGQLGGLGTAGLLIAVPGIVIAACAAYVEAVSMPLLAAEAPHLLAWDGPWLSSPLLRATAALAGLYPLGLFLLGVATWRARVLPRAGALTFTAGVVSFAVFEGVFVPILGIAATALLAAGSGWLGYALWTQQRMPASM